MKLFRRLLLSLFPEELTVHAHHPASMFLSLISPKQVFSIIHRRVGENFKLNLYDIALDPFEVKVGFGDQPTLQVKDIDAYYAYGSVAQLNGRNYFAPGNLWTVISIVLAAQGKQIWQKYDRWYGYTAIITTYLLAFLFVGRMRIFPEWSKKERYQWFVELFFGFYEFVAGQLGYTLDAETFANMKKELLREVQLFFFLFYAYQKLNDMFARSFVAPKELYSRLFADELKHKEYAEIVTKFIEQREEITAQPYFWPSDIQIAKLIFPTDMQLKYILQGEEGQAVVDHLFAQIYDLDEMETYLRSFLKNDDQLDAFLQRLLDWKTFQQQYFAGMKQVSYHEFRLGADYEEEQERDAFISSLESAKKPGELHVPESLKREGMVMDRLMNFYIWFVWGLWTGRGDAFWLRLFNRDLVEWVLMLGAETTLKQEALQRYGWLLYTYSKNLFYYTSAYEHIRAGKEVFRLPYRSTYKEVYAHMYLLKMFDEHFVYTLFQDFNSASLVITVTQSQVVRNFKHLFQERIRFCVAAQADELLEYVYGPIGRMLWKKDIWQATLLTHTDAAALVRLKERVYAVDFHLWVHATELLAEYPKLLDVRGNMGLIGICALLKETLFGFLLYVTFLQRKEREDGKTYKSQACKQIYVMDVLQVTAARKHEFLEIVDTLLVMYHPLLELWIELDDNLNYFSLGLDNWKKFTAKKTIDQVYSDVAGDDVVRCRWFYKTITYYNRRVVKPK